MANSFESSPTLGLMEFLAAVQAELDTDSQKPDLKFMVTGAMLEVDVSANLSISLTSLRRLHVYLSRTSEAPIVDEHDAVATLSTSQAPPSTNKASHETAGMTGHGCVETR